MRPYRILLYSCIYLSFTAFFCAAFAQQGIVDSVERRLARADLSPKERIDALNTLAREYVYVSFSKSFSLADSALRYSIHTNYPIGQAYAYRVLASLSTNRGLFFSANQYLEKAKIIFENANDSIGLANLYITYGHAAKVQRDYPTAIIYHKKALELFKKFNIKERIGISLVNVAESEMMNKQIESAEKNVSLAASILEELKNYSALTVCYRVQGIIAFNRGQIPQAERILKRALALTDSLHQLHQAQSDAAIQVCMQMAEIAKIKKDNKQEFFYLKKAVEWVNLEEYPRHLRTVYLALSAYYIRMNQNEKASYTIEQYKIIDDTISIRQNHDMSTLFQTTTKYTRMEEEFSHMKTESLEHQKLIKQQAFNISVAVIGLIICMILIGVMILLIKERDKLNVDLQEKNEELKKLNITKNKFFSIVAHDLKSPLKSLQGMLNLIATNNLSPDIFQKITSTLNRDLGSTLDFADNLILWAKSQMENQPPIPQAIFLKDICDAVSVQLKPQSSQKNIQLCFDISSTIAVWCDSFQLEFVIRNLISNAIKFSWVEGRVEISASIVGEFARIQVKDFGTGIADVQQAALFDVGLRSVPGTQGEKGTGLGLVLCKEFVEENAGSIYVSSQEGLGTTFFIELPLATPAHGSEIPTTFAQ